MRPADLTRSGDCLCGAPVSLHFDTDNRSVGCDVARSRFGGQAFELDPMDAQTIYRLNHIGVRVPRSLFERHLGIFG